VTFHLAGALKHWRSAPVAPGKSGLVFRKRPGQLRIAAKSISRAVSQLRERLATESERSKDAVVVTLSNLCGFEVGDY
jgi:hypothetical protein